MTVKCSWAPLGQRREVGEDVSGHHVQAGLGQLQVDRLQRVVGLHHRVLVGRAQAAGGGGRLHPAQDGGQGSHTGVRGQIHHQLTLVLVKSLLAL